MVVTDNAGNIGKSVIDNETGTSVSTPSANTNPYNLTTSAPTNLRSTTSLTIIASATDNEQNLLYYDLYWNGSSTVTQTVQGTKGNTVTFTARTGLTKRTSYSWKIVVRDGVGGQQNGAIKRAYTNCPGNDSGCIVEGNGQCTTCLGRGLVCSKCGGLTQNHSDGHKCPKCGAPGNIVFAICEKCKLCSAWTTSVNCPTCSLGGYFSCSIGASGLRVINCSTCGGTGKEDNKCLHGYGKGVTHCSHGNRFEHNVL